MAQLKVLSSGSQGNAYILECGSEQLLIELGIKWKDILKGLDYDLTKVQGCIASHHHSDHLKSIKNALKSGLSVYSCSEVQSIHQKAKVLEMGKKTLIGGFRVQPIPLEHSVQCYGFIIEHKECGKLLFATDCKEFKYKVKNLHHILIECNYSEDVLIDNMCDNVEMRSHHENHLELNDCVAAIKANYNANLQNVVLIHLSNNNSNEAVFVDTVKSAIGLNNVYVAKEGLNINLDKEEF
jgi:phosphoribosyl 1,2-cyclic phosphodiesterase